MKIKKSIINATAIVTLALALSTNATASPMPLQKPNINPPHNNTFTPLWTYAHQVNTSISATDSQLCSIVDIFAKSASAPITGRMYLEKKVGNSWEEETSWALSGTGSVFKERNYPGEPGNTYRTRVVAFVNSERVEDTSSECTI